MCRANNAVHVDLPGHCIPAVLEAVLSLINLDKYVQCPVAIMDMVDDDKAKGMTVMRLLHGYVFAQS